MTPAVALVRRWAVDWLNGRHPEACEQVLSPDYVLRIGGFLLGPRAAYVPATLAQLSRYPGLCVTTHSLVTDGTHVAITFTEHGASARLEGRAAAWTGVSVFRSDGRALDACWAEEDYAGRRRQLDSGVCDPVGPPAAAPWDELPRPADPAAEQVVRRWLAGADLRAAPVVCDDEHVVHQPEGHPAQRILDVTGCEEHVLFSAGDQVAFHVAQTGRYVGGLDGCEDALGRSTVLEVAGVVTVADGRVTGGRVVRDRLGTARALSAEVPAA